MATGGTIPVASSAVDPLAVALGYQAFNFSPYAANQESSPTSQTIFAMAIPTVPGTTYTGVALGIGTVGSGTTPTGLFLGLATDAATGVMLAQTANQATSANLITPNTGTIQKFPFTATYTETGTTSAVNSRKVIILQNGAFGTTNVTFVRITNNTELSQARLFMVAGTGQTALPANGAALPAGYTVAGATFVYFVGLY